MIGRGEASFWTVSRPDPPTRSLRSLRLRSAQRNTCHRRGSHFGQISELPNIVISYHVHLFGWLRANKDFSFIFFKSKATGNQNFVKKLNVWYSCFKHRCVRKINTEIKNRVSSSSAHLLSEIPSAYTVLGMKPKRGWYVFWLFFKICLCSAISFKRSRR